MTVQEVIPKLWEFDLVGEPLIADAVGSWVGIVTTNGHTEDTNPLGE